MNGLGTSGYKGVAAICKYISLILLGKEKSLNFRSGLGLKIMCVNG